MNLRVWQWSIRRQVWALFGLFLLTGLSVLVLEEIDQYRSRQSLQALRDDALLELRRIKSISDAYGLDHVDTTFRVRNGQLDWAEGVAVLDAARRRIDDNWTALAASAQTPGEQALFAQIAQARVRADRAGDELRALLVARDPAALAAFADRELYPAIDPVTSKLKRLSDQQLVVAEQIVAANLSRGERTRLLRVGLSLLTLTVVGWIGHRILSNAYRGIESLVALSEGMRQRDYTTEPAYRPRGELGAVLDGFLRMRSEVLDYETRLRASEARAQEASRAKSAFLATMSHEIRTPMSGVTGMLEVLAQTRLDAEQRQALNVIQASAETLLRILGDILDFSRIEAGRLALAPEPVDLGRLLREVVAGFSGAASSKGLALEVAVDPALARAYQADPLRLRQVLGNFLSNAVKFTEHGRIEAAVERVGAAADRDADGDVVCFRVSDTGIGVSAEQQARIFEPFVQAEDDTTRRYGGTGLGLAICLRLAELMGGTLAMDSAPGCGTTLRLRLTLPRASAAGLVPEPVATATTPAFVARPAPSVAAAEAAQRLVLLVDDHPTNRLVIGRQLALAGFASEAVEDGAQGLARWRSGRYALVLTDVHMPGLDGYALARAIRTTEADEGRRRTPVVALTAAALQGEAERSLAAGMDDYLTKPVAIATLAACLQRWLPPAADAGDGDTAVATGAGLPGAAAAFDPAALAALSGGDAGEIRAVLCDFLASTTRDLDELERARAARDAVVLSRQAHRIKGAARLVGANALAAIAERLETAGRSGDWAALPALAAELAAATARLRSEIAARYPG